MYVLGLLFLGRATEKFFYIEYVTLQNDVELPNVWARMCAPGLLWYKSLKAGRGRSQSAAVVCLDVAWPSLSTGGPVLGQSFTVQCFGCQ